MSLRSRIVGQFKRPHGVLGRLAGVIMANRRSNRERNNWTVGLLDLKPHHRVLEIGCGPGLALKACSAQVSKGMVVGIDHSQVMIGQARRRLAAEIKSGRVEVRFAALADIAKQPAAFDRVFSANVVQFFADLNEGFEQIHACLVEGGIVATTYQPRMKNPTREHALEMAAKIETAMEYTGFSQLVRHELPLAPVPAICVLGVRGG